MEKTLREKWIIARDQVKEMVSNEMETLPVIIFHSGDLESFKAFEDPRGEYHIPAEANPHNFTPQEIEEMVNEAFELEDEPKGINTEMSIEDFIELADFQKKEIAKLREQKNDLKKRLLENIQGIGEISKERDLWKLTAELMYDRFRDTIKDK